jgi:hypothetical protein
VGTKLRRGKLVAVVADDDGAVIPMELLPVMEKMSLPQLQTVNLS